MDKLIYTAMTGAKHTLGQQAAVAHNLANATTTGFRAELSMLPARIIAFSWRPCGLATSP